MALQIRGPKLFERDAQGQLKSRVGTVFPAHQLLVTLPGIHASQRLALIELLNEQRAVQGKPPLTRADEELECAQSVDLFFEPDHVLIRPDPAHMPLAFQADEALQELVSKRQIKFMFVFNEQVQNAIKERGEYWRISALPQSHEGMRQLIQQSHVPIHEQPIYYYSRASGTRYLTFHEFARLDRLDGPALVRQLDEIAQHSQCRNRLGNPEVDFFMAAPTRFGASHFVGVPWGKLTEAAARAQHEALKAQFAAAVEPPFREDDVRVEQWRNEMFVVLVRQKDETIAEEVLHGLSPDFFLQIEWLPGGRFEEGEFILDTIFDEAEQRANDESLQLLCDARARGFIYNFVREYWDLEYVNVGRIPQSLSGRPLKRGKRGVYIAEFKARHEAVPMVRFLRMQKWDVAERLDQGKPLLQAILESDEYADYILDRRLGCRQLGMNLIPRVTLRRIGEVYHGTNHAYAGCRIRASYFERDYLYGTATDKLPPWKFSDEDYALRVAWLLGKAAASNLIIGRTYENGTQVVFDDGDEVLMEEADLPVELIVADHSGAFDEYRRPLTEFAKDYARPINARLALVPNPRKFAEAYLETFADWFRHVQGDYRERRRAFHTLFRHCKYDPAGSYAYRWECVLRRLDATDVAELTRAIRDQITVLATSGSG